jgi:C-terminal novel E3 ligase, LRR-interacting
MINESTAHRRHTPLSTSSLAVQQENVASGSSARPVHDSRLARLKSTFSACLPRLRNATVPAQTLAPVIALQRIDTWLQAAPPEHQASWGEVAAQLKACVNDPSITTLSIQNPHITSLPNCLPKHLQELNLKNSQALETPPDVSNCPNLRVLNLRHCNALRQGSDVGQCPKLEVLELGGPDSHLCEPPNVRGKENLRILNLRRSYQLQSGPNVADCDKLERFDMHAVDVFSMPRGVFELPMRCEVTLSLVNLDSAQMGRAMKQASAYPNSPTITGFDAGLHTSAQSWLREAGLIENTQLTPEQEAFWKGVGQEDTRNSFSVMLHRLRDIEDYRNQNTRADLTQRVAALLQKVQAHPELADICCAVAQLSVTACSDLVAFGLLDMEMACVAHLTEAAVRRGECAAPELLAVGQGMHRLEQLEQLTMKRLQEPGEKVLDATEVQLFYIVRFCDQFKLPVQMRGMLYQGIANPQTQDIMKAQTMLQATGDMANDENLMRFLVVWSPMDALFEREHPAQAQALKTRINEKQNALRAELQAASNTNSGTYLAGAERLMKQFHAVHDDLSMQAKAPWIRTLMAADDAGARR